MNNIYLLNNIKYENITNLEVFKINYIKSDTNLDKYDALIFTSKNAIYSIDSFNKQWKDIPAYAIAPKTAKIINDYNGTLCFTGKSSHGNEFAQELLGELKDKKVLYIRAKEVASNLSLILRQNNINIDELITYETKCNLDLNTKIKDHSVIVFTSPSSVKCFFKNYKWNKTLKAVAIGKTTSKHIPENINCIVSPTTSIDECIKLARLVTF